MVVSRLRFLNAAVSFLVAATSLLSLSATPANGAGILFLDRCVGGCTYRAGFESAINNTSSIITGTRLITQFAHDDAFWQAHLACVRAAYAGYDIVVTDVDPGNVVHWEVPVAGLPGEIGQPPNVGGIAPFAVDCSVIHNSIAFSFANAHSTAKELCWTTAHEAAHLLGLDHEFLVRDPMTYLTGCLEKRFTSEDAECGEQAPRSCACGDPTQNADAKIASALGRAPAGAPLLLNGFSVSQDGLDEVGSTCQWTAAIGEGPAFPEEGGESPLGAFTCGTEERLRELSRAADAAGAAGQR